MVTIATALSLTACGESEQERQERQAQHQQIINLNTKNAELVSEQERQERQIQAQQQQIKNLNTKNAELARKPAAGKGDVADDESKVNTDKSMYNKIFGK